MLRLKQALGPEFAGVIHDTLGNRAVRAPDPTSIRAVEELVHAVGLWVAYQQVRDVVRTREGVADENSVWLPVAEPGNGAVTD